MNDSIHDVIIIGGGPAGCAAAIELLRRSRARGRGHDVVVIERDTYPRFHIGESMLPGTWDLIEQLGLADAISQIPHVPKFGGEFGMGDGSESTRFMFGNGLREYFAETLNIERSIFDQIFIDEARKQGADVRQGVSVKQIDNLADGDVRVTTTDGPLRGRYIIDASGQNSVIGRHLGTRRAIDDPRFKKVAYYEHFENVRRLDGKEEGHPAIAMCEEGWFWLIPINERITSVGLVLDADIARSIDVPANRMLAWGIARCPMVYDRMRDAVGPEKNHVEADYAYSCAPWAGPGYFLAGDAAAFLDPVLSAGVQLCLIGGIESAKSVDAILSGDAPPRAQRKYIKRIKSATALFFKLIGLYYSHAFREMFLHGYGPLSMHKAVVSVLSGHQANASSFSVRWRFAMFELFIKLHRRRPIVPARDTFSLLQQSPEPVPFANDHSETSDVALETA